ncbi:hypothetical protein Q5P01_003436 [Channa striata]|uniref:IPT/TIG domain-containing protein n=1 Tax=Channa striata TaxID=64152 RepID=A0AA88NME9_CHASR|nr:hypothetical protein Q5P01_003436 [Channa striata]
MQAVSGSVFPRCWKMILLPALLLILWGEPGLCLEEDRGLVFDGHIRRFAVANDTVYVATEEKLYQLSHDLTPVQNLTLRGIFKDGSRQALFYRVSEGAEWNGTLSINILLPFVENHTLISCGVSDYECGYCEILDLKNISNRIYSENVRVGPTKRSSASVAFLVRLKKSLAHTYILSATQNYDGTNYQTLNLHNTNNDQIGEIFAVIDYQSTPKIVCTGNVEFVDGFQISSTIYLLSNLPSGPKNTVRLSWLEAKEKKSDTFKSLRTVTLSVSDGGSSRLLSSSLIPGGSLWSGVFTVDGGQTNTELLVFDIGPDFTGGTETDFCPLATSKTLKPKAVLFRQKHMSSVLAVRQRGWMVFFIGTGDGQLIKLAVDKNYHTTCPKVLYRADDDRQMFPQILLDQVDRRHVYVAFRDQMKLVPVSKCSTYTTVQQCWSAQDPHCVWCGSKQSCTFEDDCKDSDWVSIPDHFQQKMVSYQLVKNSTGPIKLNIQTHLTVSQVPSNFTCHISGPSTEFCGTNWPPPQFPQCTCILTNGTIPAQGLHVTVRIRLGTVNLAEKLKLTSCPDIGGSPSSVLCQQCVKSGCSWSNNGCSWANEGVMNDSVCQTMESGMNFSRPEITSISPSVVSFYGRNHAVLSGHNLSDVTRVKIQMDATCSPQESPVWNNTDGSCHGNSQITYQSSPSCTKLEPSSTWSSGKRIITLTGSHLEFVEGIIHSHTPQEVTDPRNSSSQTLTYDTPAAGNSGGSFTSSVSLKVANETLVCSTSFTYYPDPEFISFTSIRMGDNVRITLKKKADKLELTLADVSVWGLQEEKQFPCIMREKGTSTETEFFVCEIQSAPDLEFQHLLIKYGDQRVTLGPSSLLHQVLLILRILLIPCASVALVIICRWLKKLTAETTNL